MRRLPVVRYAASKKVARGKRSVMPGKSTN
jgi:hypothetical protein